MGYDYVHSLVDDHSRLAYCESLARIAARLGVPASTAHRVLARYGCPSLAHLRIWSSALPTPTPF